jgi:hypothetical protein
MMASEYAQTAAEKAFRFQGYRFNETETAGIAKQLDRELQEVREVLALFEEEWMTPHDYEHEIEFLPKDIPCDQCDLNQRARQLAERLRVG